jgi:hypothetical protein
MDLFLTDPTEVPLPPAEVRIRVFRVEPWSDGRRVRVTLEIDPFQRRPSAEVVIRNAASEVVAEVMIIETMTRKMEFNMHLRSAETGGVYHAQAALYYQALPEVKEGDPAPAEMPMPEQVDQKESVFEITS